VIGLSIAYHLSLLKVKDVIVLDQFDFIGCGSSGCSAGGFRQQFSDEEKIALARESKVFFDNFDAKFNIPLSMKKLGYLLLARTQGELEQLQVEWRLQRSQDLPVEHLEPADLAIRFPYLQTEDLVEANLCLDDGYLNPHNLLQGFFKEASKAEYTLDYGNRVTRLSRKSNEKGYLLKTTSAP